MTMEAVTSHESARREHASLPDAERIAAIRADRWINYERAQSGLAYLEELLAYPARDRMPCLLIYGSTGMGKTKIIRKFVRDHPSAFDGGVGITRMPVVSFQMPAFPDEGQFFDELFRAMGSPMMALETTAKRTRDTCRNLLRRCDTRMLVIDEIHSMLAGTSRTQRIFLNTLRFLANDLRIPLVCVGTEEARIALQTDAQLAERFDAFELPRWKDDASFRRLLVSMASLLPLRNTSCLDTPTCRKRILKMTDGVTNRIFRLIEVAAVKAIQDGTECVTEEMLASGDLMLPLVSRKAKQAMAGGI